MCTPTILVGMAIGAVTGGIGAAVTGNDIGTGILMGGVLGGATAGFFPGSVGSLGAGATGQAGIGQAIVQIGGTTFTQSGLLTAGAVGLAGSIGKGLLLPDQPSVAGYTPAAQQSTFQNFNTNIATTGSGGRQAAKSLATAISRTKKRKLTQRDVGDLSLDTSSFTNTGLQLA
jgi:predicted lipid-binding transport protein (Tim44 family)